MRSGLLIFAVAVLANIPGARAEDVPFYFDVPINRYLKWPDAQRETFLFGIFEGIRIGGSGSNDVEPLIMCTTKLKSKDLLSIVDRYTKKHPELITSAVSSTVYSALFEFCNLDLYFKLDDQHHS